MEMSKIRQAVIKALSHRDINMKKNYQVVRKLLNITHPHYLTSKYKVWDHKVVYEEAEIPVRIYSLDERPRPLILFFHGGGYVTGNIDTYNWVCANIARITRHTVISVDYRLAPEHRFPTAPEDCYHATKEIYKVCQEYFKVSEDEITLMGDSAGATLAAVVSLMARDRKEFKVKRQILIYPATNNDYSEESVFPSVKENGTDYILTAKRMMDYLDLYQSKPEDRLNPYFTPLLADLRNQPETLVITAEYDPLRDEGEEYARRLSICGNKVFMHRIEGALHGFFTLPIRNKAVKESFFHIYDFLYQ